MPKTSQGVARKMEFGPGTVLSGVVSRLVKKRLRLVNNSYDPPCFFSPRRSSFHVNVWRDGIPVPRNR